MKSRPMIFLLLPFLIGIVLFDFLRLVQPTYRLLAIAVGLGLAFMLSGNRLMVKLILLMALLVTLGWMRSQSQRPQYQRVDTSEPIE